MILVRPGLRLLAELERRRRPESRCGRDVSIDSIVRKEV